MDSLHPGRAFYFCEIYESASVSERHQTVMARH